MNLSRVGLRLLVKDIGACFDFYTQKLGLETHWGDRNGPFVSFRVPGDKAPCLAIFLSDNQKIYAGYVPPIGSGRIDQAVYVIPTENVDEDFALLRRRGVVFMGEPRIVREWYMRCVYFRDPEGNLFELCQTIDEA